MTIDRRLDRPGPFIARERGLDSVHRLFGVGLRLQALSLSHGDPRLARDLERCVDEIDIATREVCALVAKIEVEEVVR